jgi:predicted nucleotidyltransferase
MGRTLQLGDTQVDETNLADLCGRYRVSELALFGSAARGDMRLDSDKPILLCLRFRTRRLYVPPWAWGTCLVK